MKKFFSFPIASLLASGLAHAQTAAPAPAESTNWTAVAMFGIFIAGTLWITKWASKKTQSAAAFYTGGGIGGFTNGLAISGDYMSAASFLGITAAVMSTGYDGLIYSIGFFV